MQNKINIGIIGKNFGFRVIYKSFLRNKKKEIERVNLLGDKLISYKLK